VEEKAAKAAAEKSHRSVASVRAVCHCQDRARQPEALSCAYFLLHNHAAIFYWWLAMVTLVVFMVKVLLLLLLLVYVVGKVGKEEEDAS
jgi:uncharacterized membrane protein SpoIIM required for sporulation